MLQDGGALISMDASASPTSLAMAYADVVDQGEGNNWCMGSSWSVFAGIASQMDDACEVLKAFRNEQDEVVLDVFPKDEILDEDTRQSVLALRDASSKLKKTVVRSFNAYMRARRESVEMQKFLSICKRAFEEIQMHDVIGHMRACSVRDDEVGAGGGEEEEEENKVDKQRKEEGDEEDEMAVFEAKVDAVKSAVSELRACIEASPRFKCSQEEETKAWAKLLAVRNACDHYRHLQVASVCGICYERSVNTAIVPCGHTICSVCVDRSVHTTCPVCRTVVEKTIRLFMD